MVHADDGSGGVPESRPAVARPSWFRTEPVAVSTRSVTAASLRRWLTAGLG